MRGRGLSLASGLAAHEGLAEALAGSGAPVGALIVPLAPFAVLPVGRRPIDLASGRLRSVLAEAARAFDVVLIDGPGFTTDPAAHSPAQALFPHVDAVALVADWDQLLRDTFVGAIDAVAGHANFAGIILNRTAANDRDAFAMAG